MALRSATIAIVLGLLASSAAAQEPAPPPAPATPADALRDGNAAAAQGDWAKVSALVGPLLTGQLPPADLAEAHRLAGIAAFFQGQRPVAEEHFLNYLRIELDGRLDVALYPPEVVNFFNDVRAKHDAELRKRRPKARRYWLLNLIPPGGQIQNGDKTKAWIIGGALVGFAAANLTSYFVLRSWCTRVSGPGGESVTCDESGDHSSSASTLRIVNIASGIGLILTYGFGVYDGVKGYRRKESMQPYVTPASGGGVVGVFGSF